MCHTHPEWTDTSYTMFRKICWKKDCFIVTCEWWLALFTTNQRVLYRRSSTKVVDMTSQHTIRYSTCSVQCSSILIRWSHYWLVIVHPRWMIQDRTCSHTCRWVFNIHYLYNNFASIIVLEENWEISFCLHLSQNLILNVILCLR